MNGLPATSGGVDVERGLGWPFTICTLVGMREEREACEAAIEAYFAYGPRKGKKKATQYKRDEFPTKITLHPFDATDEYERERALAAMRVYVQKTPINANRIQWGRALAAAGAKGFAVAGGHAASPEAIAAEKRLQERREAVLARKAAEDAPIVAAINSQEKETHWADGAGPQEDAESGDAKDAETTATDEADVVTELQKAPAEAPKKLKRVGAVVPSRVHLTPAEREQLRNVR